MSVPVRAELLGAGLLVVGYPVALTVVVRLVPVLRQRRWRWFVALQTATAGIVAGHALQRRPAAAAINVAVMAGLAAAWSWTGRRRG